MNYGERVKNAMDKIIVDGIQEEHEVMKCSFNLPKKLVSKIDFLAKEMRISRQSVVRDALEIAIESGIQGYAEVFNYNQEQYLELISKLENFDSPSESEGHGK